MSRYSLDQLKQKLGASGWRTQDQEAQVTLEEAARAAHARQAKGAPAGTLKEIETEIEVDLFQLQELWRHMGLPVI
jgi:hypothetical protein